jgi:hypothetical protein
MAFLQQSWSWALLLVLLPLVIHWLQIRRSKTLLFPGVYRLKMLTQSGQNPDRLRHRWLLLIRSLALLFLVLSFLWAMKGSGQQSVQRFYIAIDQGGSMKESGLSETAKIELIKWLSAAPDEARFCLPQWGSQLLSAQQMRRKIQSLDQDWPRWSAQQFRAYAKELGDPEGQFFYLCDAYGQYEDSSVQCVVYGSVEPIKNAQIDTVFRVNTEEGPAYKIEVSVYGFESSDKWPDLTLNDASGKPLQGLVYTQRGEDRAEALYRGALPESGAWFQLSPSGWSFDDRLYVAVPQLPKLKAKSLGAHPFTQRWLTSYQGFQEADSVFDVAYLSSGTGLSQDWEDCQVAIQQGSTAVCLDVSAAERLLNIDLDCAAGNQVPEVLSASGLDHPLFREVFREMGQNYNHKMPSLLVEQIPSAEKLGEWELLLKTELGTPLYLLRPEGLGRVFLWLGGAESDFIASPWSVAVLGMPAVQLTWANGPLYGVLGPSSVLSVGPIKVDYSNQMNWELIGPTDSMVPELRKRAGQWEMPLNQPWLKAGLYRIQGPGYLKTVALNEPRLSGFKATESRGLNELPAWSNLDLEGPGSFPWTVIGLVLALLFLSIESVFVFLKERNEP